MRDESNVKATEPEVPLPLELLQEAGVAEDEMHGDHVLEASLMLEQVEEVVHTVQAVPQWQDDWGWLGSSFEVYDGTPENYAVVAKVEVEAEAEVEAVGDGRTCIAAFQPRVWSNCLVSW